MANVSRIAEPLSAVELRIAWGTTLLQLSHLSPPRGFTVGESEPGRRRCDFEVPAELLGAPCVPLLVATQEGAEIVVPPRARGALKVEGETSVSVERLIRSGEAQPDPEIAGAYRVKLPRGGVIELTVGDLIFRIASEDPTERLHEPLVTWADSTGAAYTGLSLLAHAGVLGSMAFFVPPMGLEEDEAAHRERQYLVQHYLQAAAERESEQRPAASTETTEKAADAGGQGARAQGAEGAMGDPSARRASHRYGVAGPRDNPDPHLARAAALVEAQTFGLVGLLMTGMGGDPNAPTAPWGRDESLGSDPLSARGGLWGDSIDRAFGVGGLGLSGLEEGGGGTSNIGIGLDTIGTLDHGRGGPLDGIGVGHGRLPRGHTPAGPTLRAGVTTISQGHLPAEIIQRIVRQNFGRFRLCYEAGLRNNPNLEGRVTVRFAIGRDGAVSSAQNGGSDLPDASVVSCVVRGYYALSFPPPESGIVTVVYPLVFTAGG